MPQLPAEGPLAPARIRPWYFRHPRRVNVLACVHFGYRAGALEQQELLILGVGWMDGIRYTEGAIDCHTTQITERQGSANC